MKVECDSCQALVINGIPCHEAGCPNSDKEWVIAPSQILERDYWEENDYESA